MAKSNKVSGFFEEDLNGNTASYRMGYLNSRKQASKARRAYARKHKNNRS